MADAQKPGVVAGIVGFGLLLVTVFAVAYVWSKGSAAGK